MKLKSCDNCGVVLDLDKIEIPSIYDPSGLVNSNAVWDGDKFLPTFDCPVCQEKVTND